ncbi:MAG: hypothetical protein A2075_15615 [Geobacteraceae bacterium GWC2_58_44]|nr:MAG: hypothetical protein A2075_15615 [Geobacteraceae bacterium GWC2_58_44]HBG06012.1 glycosyl transferase [Geobacter sp.]
MMRDPAAAPGEAPAITVLMPVYNGAAFLGPAVASVLSQSCTDFELLAIDDGSSDGSGEIIAGYGDGRVRIHKNPENLGLIASLNTGIDLARGRYIARMDADDISAPIRLARQLEYLEQHPGVGVCSTWATFIDEQGSELAVLKTPVGRELRPLFWRPSPLVHAAAMVRTSILREHRYSPDFAHAEDYELWLRLYDVTSFHNLAEPLYAIRRHPGSVSSCKRETQLRNSHRALCRFLGGEAVSYEEFESLLHVDLAVNPLKRSFAYIRAARRTGFDAGYLLRDGWQYAREWLKHARSLR